MLAPVIAALLVPQARLSFDQIEELKHKAYRSLADFRESLVVEISAENQKRTWILTQRIQGAKLRLTLFVDGVKQIDVGHDGSKQFAILHPTKQYRVFSGPNRSYQSKFQKPDYSKSPVGDFSFNFQDGYNVRFMANPPLKVSSDSIVDLNGVPARKVVASTTVEPGKRYVTVTQYFYTDRWILRAFLVEGRGKTGPFKIQGAAQTTFAAASKPGMFKMDPNLVKGYKLVKS